MFDKAGHVKLVDFGLSSVYDDRVICQPLQQGRMGSLSYMAPELFIHHSGGRHIDWFAYGVLAYTLLTGKTPWSSMTDREEIIVDILHLEVSLPLNSGVSNDAFQFVKSLLCKDFMYRLGTMHDSDIKRASFFKHINWENMLQLRGELPPFRPKKRCVIEAHSIKAIESFQTLIADDVNTETAVVQSLLSVQEEIDSQSEKAKPINKDYGLQKCFIHSEYEIGDDGDIKEVQYLSNSSVQSSEPSSPLTVLPELSLTDDDDDDSYRTTPPVNPNIKRIGWL